jgi:hypothetical protein
MDNNLFDLYQNTVLSTIILHTFTLEYNKVAKNYNTGYSFPKFEYMFYVLPIVYNKRARKAFIGGRYINTILSKDNFVITDLQDKANKMSEQTFDALNLAFSKNILVFNESNVTIETFSPFHKKRIGISKLYSSLTDMQKCAATLGHIFAKSSDKNIQINLNIRF